MVLEPTIINEYSSERGFHLHDASWGSSCILLRSFKSMFVANAIDLIFLSTDYIEIPFRLHGLRVTRPRDEAAIQCYRSFNPNPKEVFDLPEGWRVFAIESEGKRFHIISGKMWVLVHDDLNEGSSIPPMLKDLDKREEYLARHVKEWYKLE